MTHLLETRDVARLVRRQQRGLSLIELLVAIAIGAVLIFGATQAYVDSRNAYTVNESVSRMQENARYAMSVLEPDLRMSNFWGLQKGAETISNKFKKTDTPQTAFAGNAASDCGTNYGIDLENNIEGTDASYPTTATTCAPFHTSTRLVQTADTITIRRASTIESTTAAGFGSLRICSTRAGGILVTDTSTSAICAGATAPLKSAQINDLIVNLYYVDRDSDPNRTDVPSLRRRWLDVNGSSGTKNSFQEAEVISGVEDMQVQYGVDRSGGYGPTGGAAVQYLDAGATLSALLNAATNPAQIVSVRIWLLVRADEPEVGFTDNRVYIYGTRTDKVNKTGDLNVAADVTKGYQPSLNSDTSPTGLMHYRRVLISRTIQVRNALGT